MSENMLGVNPPVEMQKRLNNLRATDSEYVDSVAVLAKKEDTFRTEHLDQGVPNIDIEKRNRTANAYSDEVLKTMEAERANGVDALTKLLNRRALDQELPRFLGREIQGDGTGAVLMIDFDHFKSVDDTYGHLAGDEALRQLAKIIKDTVRPTDRVYRYGGEEFLVFLPKTGVRDAEVAAEHIRSAIEKTPIEVTDERREAQSLHKTVSIGCVGLDTAEVRESCRDIFDKAKNHDDSGKPPMADDVDTLMRTLIRYADIAGYAAKAGDRTNPDESKRKDHDRNQVVVYREGLPLRNANRKE